MQGPAGNCRALLRREYRKFSKAAGAGKTPQTLANSGESGIIESDEAGSMGVDIEAGLFTGPQRTSIKRAFTS